MEVKWSRYDFSQRPVDDSSETRLQTTFALNLRAQRELWKGYKLFAEYEREQSFSNDVTDEYRVNTAAAGLLFEF